MTQAQHARQLPTKWLRIGIPVLLVLVWLAVGSIGGPYFGKVDQVSSNDRSTFLPESADATQVNERLGDLLGEESIPAVVVVTGDGDLTDALVDAKTVLDDSAVIWVLTPKAGRGGHIDHAEIEEAATTAGLHATSTFSIAPDWSATRLGNRGRGK